MYERILVPTDGSEGATAAATHAIDLADRYGATLHVLYAVPTSLAPDAGLVGALDALEATGRAAVEELRELAESGGIDAIEGTVQRGRPHEVIGRYVEDNDIDLVVMGTHGRSGLDRVLLGSVTEKVVRTSEVPVLTVRAPENG